VIDSQKLDLNQYLGEPLENRDKVSDVLAWWLRRDFFISLPFLALVQEANKKNDRIEPAPDPDGKRQKVSEVWKDFDKFIDKK